MTILYIDDWNKYPNAIVDYSPENKLWIIEAKKLELMGVKNNKFFLSLLNPNLKGVDPYDPNLSDETKRDILAESKINYWYKLRTQRAPGESGSGIRKLEPNRMIIALSWLYLSHITVYLVAPRQVGKSFIIWVLVGWLITIRCEDTSVNLVTKNRKLLVESVDDVKKIIATYPDYLNTRTKDDTDNTVEVSIASLGNKLETHLSSADPVHANNVCRGTTAPTLIGDEHGFIPNNRIAMAAATQVGNKARKLADESGSPWGTIYATSAAPTNTEKGAFAHSLFTGSFVWTELMFDMADANEVKMTAINNSRDKKPRIGLCFNHLQLGLGEEWFRAAIESADSSDKESIGQELLNIWSSGDDLHPIDIKVLDVIKASEVAPVYTEISKIENYIARWYIPKEDIARYMAHVPCVMALDTSDAGGGDDIGMCITSIHDGSVVAAGTYNATNIILLSSYFYLNFIQKYTNLLTIIERKSTGSSMIDDLVLRMLTDNINPFKRLWNTVVQSKDSDPVAFKDINNTNMSHLARMCNKYKKCIGFSTAGGEGLMSRKRLYSDVLGLATEKSCNTVKDAEIVSQLRTLTRRNGRVDHEVNAHDDMVIAWLLTHFVMMKSTNMNFYGIDANHIMSKHVSPFSVKLSNKEIAEKKKQEIYRKTIDKLIIQHGQSVNRFVKIRLEKQILSVAEKINVEDIDVNDYSMAGLLEDLKTKRRYIEFVEKGGVSRNR